MDFFNPEHNPQPRENVKIEALEVFPYPDRARVFIHLRVTPFQERPNLLLTVRDEKDVIVGEMTVIETMHSDMEFTMHLRGIDEPAGLYTLTATLFFDSKNPPHDEVVEAFEIPTAEEPSSNGRVE